MRREIWSINRYQLDSNGNKIHCNLFGAFLSKFAAEMEYNHMVKAFGKDYIVELVCKIY